MTLQCDFENSQILVPEKMLASRVITPSSCLTLVVRMAQWFRMKRVGDKLSSSVETKIRSWASQAPGKLDAHSQIDWATEAKMKI